MTFDFDINRFQEVAKPLIEQQKIYDKEFRERDKKQKKIYFSSEEGKKESRKGWKLRQERMKKAKEDTSWEEIRLINKFYRNCPEGYQVDHIVPISRGGKHTLSNLQYLTRDENAYKFTKAMSDEIKGIKF